MSVLKYRHKPTVIEAMQLQRHNIAEVAVFCGGTIGRNSDEQKAAQFNPRIYIHTLEGDVHANVGDFVVKGVKGEFYPVKSDIFIETYEVVEQ